MGRPSSWGPSQSWPAPGAGSHAAPLSQATLAIGGPTSRSCCTDELIRVQLQEQCLAQRTAQGCVTQGRRGTPEVLMAEKTREVTALFLDQVVHQHVDRSVL